LAVQPQDSLDAGREEAADRNVGSAVIHWSADNWKTVQDIKTYDVGLGIHMADLFTQALSEGRQINFTLYWPDARHWEGKNFVVRVGAL
jgi:glucoamylase